MSKLGSYLTNKLEAWFDVEGFPGFKVKVAYLSRQRLSDIRKAATRSKMNHRTREMEETLNEEVFMKAYIEESILDWEGFTIGAAKELMPLSVPAEITDDTVVDYSSDEARSLVENSTYFDGWLSEVTADLSRFQG